MAASEFATRETAFPAGDGALPVGLLRQRLDDLFVPRPYLYWLDFLGSITMFYAAFALALPRRLASPVKYLWLALAVLALYRAVVFVHELAHLPRRRMRGFRIVWNLCCGIPLLMPSFTYSNHLDHHAPCSYGTAKDGEYRNLAAGARIAIVALPAAGFFLPFLAVLRFLVMSPLSWANPSIRRWVDAKASSLVIDPRYVRKPPAPAEARCRMWEEIAVFAYLAVLGAGLLTGRVGAGFALQLYATAAAVIFLNALRTLAAHRYRSPGAPLSLTGQYLDSLNYPRRSWLIPLWAPLGLRFHALHHLFPGIPYHNLRAAHDRLTELLPADSPYHRATARGMVGSLRELWRNARPEEWKPASDAIR